MRRQLTAKEFYENEYILNLDIPMDYLCDDKNWIELPGITNKATLKLPNGEIVNLEYGDWDDDGFGGVIDVTGAAGNWGWWAF